MNGFMRQIVLCVCILVGFSTAIAQSTANIFVQDPSVFHQHLTDLEKLRSSLGNSNEGLDSLFEDAGRIAKKNDLCSVISINDAMDEGCWTFYKVELPAFEEKYMRVTGEVRLGYMETTRGLEDRKMQILACVDALYSLANSKDQFLNLLGGVSLEPLSEGFEANYDFTLQYEQNHRDNMFAMAQKWGETCREMVIRVDGKGFAPFFLERLALLDDELEKSGSRAVFKVDSAQVPLLYMDNSKPIRSAYYLNGIKLFHTRISSGPVEESNLRIAFDGTSVKVDGEQTLKKNGTTQNFASSVRFSEKAATMYGRWIWENAGNTDGIDFGPDYDEDSLKVALAEETAQAAVKDSVRAAEEMTKAENRRGTHFSPWIAVSGGVALYSHETHKAFALEKNAPMILTDLAGAARVRLNFGETGEGFVAVGAGAFVGAGINGEIQRLYIAPLAQVALGYKDFGFRETAVIAIPEDGSEEWMQFRSGLFFNFGFVGVEVGHDLVTNLGQGVYMSIFFEM